MELTEKQIRDNPALKKFKVKKSGSTKDDTTYLVIPIITQ